MANDHVLRLGKLVANIQSLEAMLRIYLLKNGSGDAGKEPYWDLVKGDVIEVDEFSNYDSLRQLVGKYNDSIRSRAPDCMLDPSIVDLRDLLAHGRVAGTAENTATLRVIKFGKPNDGRVVVTHSVLMSDEWLDRHIRRCKESIFKVGKALESHRLERGKEP